VPTIVITPLYQIGQEVFQTEIKVLVFNLVGMHTPSPTIEEDVEFQRGLRVKQILEFAHLENLRSFSLVWTFETNAF
jgi:hypothetical protein